MITLDAIRRVVRETVREELARALRDLSAAAGADDASHASPTTPASERFLTTKQALAWTGFTRSKFDELERDGRLVPVRINGRGRKHYRVEDLDRLFR